MHMAVVASHAASFGTLPGLRKVSPLAQVGRVGRMRLGTCALHVLSNLVNPGEAGICLQLLLLLHHMGFRVLPGRCFALLNMTMVR